MFVRIELVYTQGQEKVYVLKNDKFRRNRGGDSRLYDINCVKWNSRVLLYQKDGPGNLLRCYIDRIFEPEIYTALQEDKSLRVKSLLTLKCLDCGEVIGFPMIYARWRENRLAYRLKRGSFHKQLNHSQTKWK